MTSPTTTIQQKELRFGPFQLHPARRLLLADGHAVRIGNRAFDILLALIARAGEVITKEELIAAAWPATVVEEINLRVHIAALRRALGGNRYIVNVAGRGYSFVGTLHEIEAPRETDADRTTDAADGSNLPTMLTRLIGRDAAIESLAQLVPERRLVTIVGTGGVGKSTLALAVATQLREHYRHGTYFLDLAAIGSGASVSLSLATAIGLTIPVSNPVPNLLSFVQQKQMLLVIDNCEHVVDMVATLAERLLKNSPGIRILATSREPLGAEGEWLHRLPPLEVPHISAHIDAASADAYSALQLFVERARTLAQSFELTDASAPAVGDICRRLDGIPLAIELVVSRLNMFGIDGLAARLDDHFLLVAQGRRTAAPRHQTLRATLDWSYQLLDAAEQRALRRLSIFNGSFEVESAIAVAGNSAGDAVREPADTIFECVLSLADKSLLATESHGDVIRHRLLHTTRAFAFEKLAATDDSEVIQRWHAEHYLELLRKAEAEWDALPKRQWFETYAHAVDDVRAALDWAFSLRGDVVLGARLTVAAMPFGFNLALMDEFREYVEHALERLASLEEPEAVLESQLSSALHLLTWNTHGMSPDFGVVATELRTQAQRIGVVNLQVEPLVNETVAQIELGEYAAAIELGERLQRVAALTEDPLAVLIGQRVMAQVQHFAGHHDAARALVQSVLEHPARSIPLNYHRLSVDRRVSMRIVLARILWLEGCAEQAAAVVEECLANAMSDTPFAICQALALAACPIALWCGDFAAAQRHVEQLLDITARFRIKHWEAYGYCYARMLQPASTHAETAEALAAAIGNKRDTILTIDPAAFGPTPPLFSEQAAQGWCAPEILRVHAEHLLALPAFDDAAARAETLLLRSLVIARSQNALAWQLRTATSLARLWRGQRRETEGRELLAQVHGLFTEGHATRDLVRARELLAVRDSGIVEAQ